MADVSRKLAESLIEDITKALVYYSDVPEFVEFRYQRTGKPGIIRVYQYDDAMPNSRPESYILNLTETTIEGREV